MIKPDWPIPPRTHLTGDQLRQAVADVEEWYAAGATLREIAELTGMSYGRVQGLRALGRVPARRYGWTVVS